MPITSGKRLFKPNIVLIKKYVKHNYHYMLRRSVRSVVHPLFRIVMESKNIKRIKNSSQNFPPFALQIGNAVILRMISPSAIFGTFYSCCLSATNLNMNTNMNVICGLWTLVMKPQEDVSTQTNKLVFWITSLRRWNLLHETPKHSA